MSLFPETTGAVFSPCRRYRYQLWRIWDRTLPLMAFIGMNPSTADETDNDATVERMVRRALKWSFGGLIVGNAFAYRETDSRLLQHYIAQGIDIVGPDNDANLREIAKRAGLVVCGWGVPGKLLDRGTAVLELLREAGVKPHALDVNFDGTPMHPLYIAYTARPRELA